MQSTHAFNNSVLPLDEPEAQARVFLPLPSGERAGERGRLSPPPPPVGEVSAKQTEGANSSSLSRAPRERAGVRAPDLPPSPLGGEGACEAGG